MIREVGREKMVIGEGGERWLDSLGKDVLREGGGKDEYIDLGKKFIGKDGECS